jgi:hypothetical protein
VALAVDPEGIITAFGLAGAASDERPIGDALIASERHGAYLADKGFTGIEWEQLWMEIYGALGAATPEDNSHRAWSKADRRWATGKRQIIEGVIYQLKDFFSVERHRAKTLGGLLTASGRQGCGLHLPTTHHQRLPWPTAAPSGRPVDLAHYTSVVLVYGSGSVR